MIHDTKLVSHNGAPQPDLFKLGIGKTANCALEAGLDNADVLEFILEVCPDACTTMDCVRWYRSAAEGVATAVDARFAKKTSTGAYAYGCQLGHYTIAFKEFDGDMPSGAALRDVALLVASVERSAHLLQPGAIVKTASDGFRRHLALSDAALRLDAMGQSAMWLADTERGWCE